MCAKKAKEKKIEVDLFGVYSIHFPRKEGWKYSPPFLAVNDKVALKALCELVKEHPELQRKNVYAIGTFDPSTGIISPLKEHRRLKG